ncbi:helix-turn-helix domain-containing protein [Listeria monocytogenes]|uniref:helix-turn-helix domain-containing protein n=1 Tax=Listeria monocytogenes TaxID=1639 RepID=UPI001E525164|nr:helix-turn-helix transcriptional regulator [Listeria monocytogenes]EHD1702306.1 helix-turn-helix transcriptional regulator [Listeria monocytogenes]MCD2219564.1 helix-turn-helix domain-containing protein [Listeria monocytogenes]
MDIYDRIKKLAETSGITIKELESNLGFVKNSLYKWKKASPSIDRVEKVAEYFNVSIDFLLGRSENTELDTIYQNALEELNRQRFSVLLEYINNFFTLSINERQSSTEYALYDLDAQGDQIGSFVEEMDLINQAGSLITKLDTIPFELTESYQKARIASLFTGNSYKYELSKLLASSLTDNYTNVLSLVSDLLDTNDNDIYAKKGFSYMFYFDKIFDKNSFQDANLILNKFDYLLQFCLIINIKDIQHKVYQDIFVKRNNRLMEIEFPGGSSNFNYVNISGTKINLPNSFYDNLKLSIHKKLETMHSFQLGNTKDPIEPDAYSYVNYIK